MRRAVRDGDLAVVLWPVVLVANENGDGRAERSPVVANTGEDLRGIRLLARRCDARLSRSTAVELKLHIVDGDGNTRGAPVDDASDATAVRLAEGGDAEEVAERVGRGCLSPHGGAL